jgi:hypothetical protein
MASASALSEPAASRLWGALARFLAGLFYRRVEVVGLERVPPSRPNRDLSQEYRTFAVLRYGLREGLALARGLLLALWGVVTHVAPYQATALAVLVDRDLRGHLLGRRRAIMVEFQDLLRLVPGPVLDGRPQ